MFRAIAWQDSGLSFNDSYQPPWPIHQNATFPQPTRQNLAAFRNMNGQTAERRSYKSSAANDIYGLTLKSSVAVAHPDYALTELFHDSSAGMAQLLGHMELKIKEYRGALIDRPSDRVILGATQVNVIHSQYVLEACLQDLRDTHSFLKHKFSSDTGYASPSTPNFLVAREAFTEVLEDFASLIVRAESLIRACENVFATATSNFSLQEAREGVQASKRTFKFTVIATIFVPLAFLASFFGMNFAQFGQGDLDLAWFGYIAAPVVAVSIGVLFIDIAAVWGSLYERLRNLI